MFGVIEMRSYARSIAGIVILCALVMSPSVASAKHIVHFEITVAPGSSYAIAVPLGGHDVLNVAWTADYPLKFTLSDPDGSVLRHSSGTSGSVIVNVTVSGNYTAKWLNEGIITASLSYDYSFGLEGGLPLVWTAVIIIVVIALAALIILVVVLLMRGK